jgi:glycerol uptake facilitator protein
MQSDRPSLLAACIAEFVGTFLLVLFGCGSVHAATLVGAQNGLWQVAIVWGLAIMLAIYVVGAISGAHINPAISIGLAFWGKFPMGRVLPYILFQTAGAFVAAAALFAVWSPYIVATERVAESYKRGNPDSIYTASCYGEYFPNPGVEIKLREPMSPALLEEPKGVKGFARNVSFVSHGVAFGAEALGTLILALVICSVTDPKNSGAPSANLAPVFIGLSVAALISIIAPLTQACFNPARDFGPRLFAYLAGWGEIAIPGPNGTGFATVYLLAPCVGSILGVGIHKQIAAWRVAGD